MQTTVEEYINNKVMRKPILLELFAWTRSVWKVAEKYWYEVYSLEIDPRFWCNLTMDILDFRQDLTNFVPDVIWASPDCTSFSMAGISHHRTNWIAYSEKAKLWDKLLEKTCDIISYYKLLNPKLKFFIENPRAMMRKSPIMTNFLEYNNGKIDTVTYCQYWDKVPYIDKEWNEKFVTRMKPTDIFNNCENFIPKICKNWDICHDASPRWSQTWTQLIKWSKDRSIIPELLCQSIILSTL